MVDQYERPACVQCGVRGGHTPECHGQLTGFAKVLADWTQQLTQLNYHIKEAGPEHVTVGVWDLVCRMAETTAVFERLMGVDDTPVPEQGRVLFCPAPQLGTVMGRTTGNGDARYDVKLWDGRVITVPADFIGGEDQAAVAWLETKGVAAKIEQARRHLPTQPSPDGKR